MTCKFSAFKAVLLAFEPGKIYFKESKSALEAVVKGFEGECRSFHFGLREYVPSHSKAYNTSILRRQSPGKPLPFYSYYTQDNPPESLHVSYGNVNNAVAAHGQF